MTGDRFHAGLHLTGALVLSLGVNVWLALRPSGPPTITPAEGRASGREAPEERSLERPPAARDGGSEPPTGASGLAERHGSRGGIGEWLSGRVGDAGTHAEETRPRAGGSFEAPEVDEELTRELLCQVARDHLRRHWTEQRSSVLAGLRRSLADADEQRRNTEREIEAFAAIVDLPASRRGELERRYRDLRARRMEAAGRAANAEPPDYGALLATARGLFADEDALMGELVDAERLRRFRASQAEKRTAILALLATYADEPWGEAVLH